MRTETFTPSNDIFNWSVSSFQFDLSQSNVFFLWLYPDASTEQGTDEPKESVTSRYFNITALGNVAKPDSSSVATRSTISILTLFHLDAPTYICLALDVFHNNTVR
jgi:hypothetical protein